jgi:uncharacterized membrane protein YfhO
MGKNAKKSTNRVMPYIIPALVTLVALLVIMVSKGIFPFGSNRIDYFDNMQQVAPLYAHLWDWMHGKASLWFDWYTGLGTNVSMSISAFSMLSPFNLLLYLVPRDLILESISILTILKMMVMSVTMYAAINYRYKNLSYWLKLIFSLMYAFGSYALLYGSCFTPWMDIVAFFPLLMLGFWRMVDTGKRAVYIFILALLFIINYYLAAMSVIYVLVVSGVYILLGCERKTWKTHAWNLGVSTAGGIGLSAFVLVPVMIQLSGSQRGGSGGNLAGQYIGWIKSAFVTDGAMAAFQRWMMVYGLAFAVAVIVIGLKKYWNDKNSRNKNLILILVAVLPIAVEGINLMWHFGSYNGYTLRDGFLFEFTLIMIAAEYAQKLFTQVTADFKAYKKWVLFACVAALVFIIVYNILPVNNVIIAGIFYLAVFVAMIVAHLKGISGKLASGSQTVNAAGIIILVAVELFVSAYAMIGAPKFFDYEPYQYGDYVEVTNEVKENLDIEESATDRIINPDLSLNANYPLILRRGALSSFTAALQGDTQAYAKRLGYSKYFLWLLDSGGTIFTNTLFHITSAVNVNELDSKFYTPVSSSGDYTLYSANYVLPFAYSVSSAVTKADVSGNWIDTNNALYKALTGDKEDLIEGFPGHVSNTATTRTYDITVTGNKALYINIVDINNRDSDANASWLISSMHIYVNDEVVTVPTLGDVENTAYFTDYNNNLVYLGCFSDTSVSVRVEYDDAWYNKVSEVKLAGLDMDKFEAFVASKQNAKCETSYTNDSITMTVESGAGENMVLIPIVYSDNWKITVNGKEVDAKSRTGVARLFTAVTVTPGQENTIVMTFEPEGRKAGLLISLFVIVVIAVFGVLKHFTHYVVPKWMRYVAGFVYVEVIHAVALFMFVIPTVAAVPAVIYQIVMKIIG